MRRAGRCAPTNPIPTRPSTAEPAPVVSAADRHEVEVHAAALDRLAAVLSPALRAIRTHGRAARTGAGRASSRQRQLDRHGGGVAELLQTLLAYAAGAGVDTRWLVIDGDAGFFEITKRIHNHLYGTPATADRSAPRARPLRGDRSRRNVARATRGRRVPATS